MNKDDFVLFSYILLLLSLVYRAREERKKRALSTNIAVRCSIFHPVKYLFYVGLGQIYQTVYRDLTDCHQ